MSRTRTEIIDGRDEGGNTELMRAALYGQSETVKTLLLDGADVNARNHDGRTALMFAIANLHASTVQTLLEFGADVNVQASACGCTPLLLAAGSGDIGITGALLKSGADPETICRPGRTALLVARERGHSDVVELIKRALAQAAGKPSLRSNVQSFTRARALAVTK